MAPSHRIREIRREKQLSGTEIAEKLHMSAQHYYSIERGTRGLSSDITSKLAGIFGVTTDYLLGLSEEPDIDIQPRIQIPQQVSVFEEYREYLAVKAIAEKYGYQIDEKFLYVLELALDFVNSVNRMEDK